MARTVWKPGSRGTVLDYFEMLRAGAAGVAFNKSEHNQALRRTLKGRGKSSVELKHQNFSAVLDALGNRQRWRAHILPVQPQRTRILKEARD